MLATASTDTVGILGRPAKLARWPPAEHPASARKSGSPPNCADICPRPRESSIHIVQLARPAVVRTGPILDGQAHPSTSHHVSHQRVALEFPPPENPSTAGDEDEYRGGLFSNVAASPHVEQLAGMST